MHIKRQITAQLKEGEKGEMKMNWNKMLAALIIISFVFVSPVPVTSAPAAPLESPIVTEFTAVVTLITGDVLEVTKVEGGGYMISTDSSRAFEVISTGEGTYVIPEDVRQLVGDTLDMELFNIDYWIENGYCDSEVLPVIIEYSTNPGRDHAKINTAPGLLKKLDFEVVYASSAEITKQDVDDFATELFYTKGGFEGVKKIWLDRKIKLFLDESVPGIGAPYVWEQGFDGTGIKIAILDTGIWKDHPDLAGKVIAEKDFTDDMTTEDLHGHGTHCAGIVAANGTLKGVAPGASLINAKVMNKNGVGYSSWIIAGWEWAAEQGAHIFSMSFGGGPTDGTGILDKALNAIVEEYNIVAVAAAGNLGTYYGIETPAAADNAIAVGATTTGLTKLSVVSPEVKDIQANLMEYSPKPPLEGIEKPVVYAGLGSVEDFAQVDVAGKIALIQRGGYTFKEKVQNAADAGAVAAIIFNNVPGNFLGTLTEPGMIPAVSISLEDGNYLLSLLETGEVIVNLRWDPEAVDMATFSSRGPRLDYAVKPEIVAPGVSIKSTVPTYECKIWHPSGYGSVSGTSMSTPHIAGAAALLLQKYPDWKWSQIRNALMSSTDIMLGYDIYTQGSGFVAVDKAIDTKVVFEPAKLSFGKIAEPWTVQSKSLSVRNYGDKDVTLELSVEKGHDIIGNIFDLATLDKYTITVTAGGIETVTLSVDLSAAPTNVPIGGRVIGKNIETGEEIHAIFGIFKEFGVELRIKVIDPNGEPWAKVSGYVHDAVTSRGASYRLNTDANGEATAIVPPGYYFINFWARWKPGNVWPESVNYKWILEEKMFEAGTITLDARNTQPITLNNTVERTIPTVSWAYSQCIRADGSLALGVLHRSAALWRYKWYTVPVTPEIGEINAYYRFEEVRETTPINFTDPYYQINYVVTSPVLYDFFFTQVGHHEPIVYTVNNATLEQMVLVKAKYFSIAATEQNWIRYGVPSEFTVTSELGYWTAFRVPIERTEYLTPFKYYMQRIRPANYKAMPPAPYRPYLRKAVTFHEFPEGSAYEVRRFLSPGETIERTWFEQPMKPWAESAKRTGNTVEVSGYQVADVSINLGVRTEMPKGLESFITRVYKDDNLIYEAKDQYYWKQVVSPEEAEYRIEIYSKPLVYDGKLPWTNYSTESWTTIIFSSKYVDGTENLPIMNLNYKIPGLRVNNVKVVSKKDPINIHIKPQNLAGLNISEIRFWYSYDDGATWTEVDKVVKGTNEWIVKPDYQEGYISIKTLAIDEQGNSVEQTIIRAFYVTTTKQTFWFDN